MLCLRCVFEEPSSALDVSMSELVGQIRTPILLSDKIRERLRLLCFRLVKLTLIEQVIIAMKRN